MIIDAVNENVDVRRCTGKGGCQEDGTQCLTHLLWEQLSDRITSFLDGITLEELMATDHVQHVSEHQNNKFTNSELLNIISK